MKRIEFGERPKYHKVEFVGNLKSYIWTCSDGRKLRISYDIVRTIQKNFKGASGFKPLKDFSTEDMARILFELAEDE